MKKIIRKFIYKFIDRYFDFVFDYKTDEIMEKENLRHWYKARRMGYKKKDMGFYYSDLQNSNRTNFLGMENNNIYL